MKMTANERWAQDAGIILDLPDVLKGMLVYPDMHSTWEAYREAVRKVAKQEGVGKMVRVDVEWAAWRICLFHVAEVEPPDPVCC